MENIELYYVYFTRPEGAREVGDPLPYYGALQDAKSFCARYFATNNSSYRTAEIVPASDLSTVSDVVENPRLHRS